MRTFPIIADRGVPFPRYVFWALAEEAFVEYRRCFGNNQSLERLAERGGFGAIEFAILLAGKGRPLSNYRDEALVAQVLAAARQRIADYALE